MQAAINSTPLPAAEPASGASPSSTAQGARANSQNGEKFAAALRDTTTNSLESKDNTSPAEASADPAPTAQPAPSQATDSKAGNSSAQSSGDSKGADKPDNSAPVTAVAQPESGNGVPSWLPEWLVTSGVVNAGAVQPQPAACTSSTDVAINATAPTAPAPTVAANPMLAGMLAETNSASIPGVATGKVDNPPTTNAPDSATPLVLSDKPSAQDSAPPVTPQLEPQLAKHEVLPSNNDNLQTTAATTTTDRSVDAQAALMPRNDLNFVNNAVSTASTLIAQQASPPAINTASTPVTTTLSMPMSDPRWQEAFATQVTWQVRDGLQHVNLALNPAELGPVEVRLSVNDGQVSAQFHTAHQSVRQVIEDAMPKLRDMLSQSGLNLADANVFQQSPGRDRRPGQIDTPWSTPGTAVDEAETVSSVRSVSLTHQGLIDAYV